MVSLECESLTTGYVDEEVVRDISFTLEQGDILGIVGPNGSGKSTLIRAITGVIEPWSGGLSLDGRSIKKLSRREIARKVAVVPQDTFISFPYTAWEVVMMGRNPYLGRLESPDKKDRAIVKEAMDGTATLTFKDRPVGELSGGELQRVVVARALAQDTDLLLLDEATSHLDIGHKVSVMDLVKRKNREGDKGVLSVHHNLDLAARYCDRLILIDEGEIHAEGSPKDVLTPPHLRAVYGIEAEVHQNPRNGSLYVTPVEDISGLEEKKETIHIVAGGGSGSDLMKSSVEEGYRVTAGVLNAMDSDLERAEFLDIDVVVEAPFTGIGQKAYRQNLKKIEEADIVVGTDFPVGKGNLRNVKALKRAVEEDRKVFLLDEDSIEERDYTGGKAAEIYEDMLESENVTVVEGWEDLRSLLENG